MIFSTKELHTKNLRPASGKTSMHVLKNIYIVFFLLSFGLLTWGCPKEQDSAPELQRGQQETALAEQATKSRTHESPNPSKEGKRSSNSPHALEGPGLLKTPNSFTKERLLEYIVSLQYKSKDFSASRRLLLEITSRYGFIASSQAVAGEDPYLESTIRVKAKELYTVLKELDGLGKLKSENIRTIDHTEAMVLQERRLRREKVRQIRRSKASSNTTRKDWTARERLLAASEDKEDLAEHEKWKIQDKVTWARIHISVHGPKSAPEIQVPVYTSAFVELINFLLVLSYLAIYLVPLLLLLYGIWRFGIRRLWRLFQKKQ